MSFYALYHQLLRSILCPCLLAPLIHMIGLFAQPSLLEKKLLLKAFPNARQRLKEKINQLRDQQWLWPGGFGCNTSLYSDSTVVAEISRSIDSDDFHFAGKDFRIYGQTYHVLSFSRSLPAFPANVSRGITLGLTSGVLLSAQSLDSVSWPTQLIRNRRQLFRLCCSLCPEKKKPFELQIRSHFDQDLIADLQDIPLIAKLLFFRIRYHIDGWWATNADFPDPLGKFEAEDGPIKFDVAKFEIE